MFSMRKIAAGLTTVGTLGYLAHKRQEREAEALKASIFLGSILITGRITPENATFSERVEIFAETERQLTQKVNNAKINIANEIKKDSERIAIRYGI